MLTRSQVNDLLGHAQKQLARAVAGCAIEGSGQGVEVDGGALGAVVRCHPRREDGATTAEMLGERIASELFLEVKAGRLYVNYPPINGVAPTIDGVSIFNDPRPSLELSDVARLVYLKVSYERVNAGYDSSGGVVTAGTTLTMGAVEVLTAPVGTVLTDVVPVGNSDRDPQAGEYESYFVLGSVTGATILLEIAPGPGVFAPVFFGGYGMQTGAEFGGSEWSFFGAWTAP